MDTLIDLDRYPLNRPESSEWKALVVASKAELESEGLFNLAGFVRPESVERAVRELKPVLDTAAFRHRREHNIYFQREVNGLAADHPALKIFTTANHTICADQMTEAMVMQLYLWEPFRFFLAAVMEKDALYTMADPLARANVMAYRNGEALNWHFDRSEFTTTLLLQAPETGGVFEYVKDLRSDEDPNYDGVASLLLDERSDVAHMPLEAGTLNIFRGKNTAHRVSPIRGNVERIIAVFSYYERPGVQFSAEERIGFYGRAA
jgi:hypothetical protein